MKRSGVWQLGRPRANAKEWDEAETASTLQGFRYALWLMLWHYDADDEFGSALAETRKPGYDGGLVWQ